MILKPNAFRDAMRKILERSGLAPMQYHVVLDFGTDPWSVAVWWVDGTDVECYIVRSEEMTFDTLNTIYARVKLAKPEPGAHLNGGSRPL
jgi:hypothetical protein